MYSQERLFLFPLLNPPSLSLSGRLSFSHSAVVTSSYPSLRALPSAPPSLSFLFPHDFTDPSRVPSYLNQPGELQRATHFERPANRNFRVDELSLSRARARIRLTGGHSYKFTSNFGSRDAERDESRNYKRNTQVYRYERANAKGVGAAECTSWCNGVATAA